MTELTSIVTEVIVYPDRARVTRKGSAKLEAGSQTLLAAGLPLALNPDSLRAAAESTVRARLLGIQVQRVYYTETPSEAVHQLETQIEALNDDLKRRDAQAETVKHNRTLLDLLSGHTEMYATALAANETTVEKQLALFDGLRARAEKLDSELLDIATARREIERRLKKLQNELEQLRSARPRERYSALIEVEMLEPGELTVELAYVVNGAGWKPLYDFRLIEMGEKPALEVGYLAQVTQQTGEDWDGVSVALSTARPALASKIPELKPWYIQPRFYPPPAAQAARRELKAATFAAPAPMQAMAGAVPELEPAPIAAEEITASVSTTGAAVTYEIPVAASIPSDGAPHKVTVARFSLQPRLDYVAAPKLVEEVYRRARAANDSPYLLLPGAANLFMGEEFIGATSLELIAPQGEIELYLGVDDRVKIELELKRREVDKTIIGGKRRVRFGYEVTLENLLLTEAAITVHDQIPVSKDEAIKIKLEAAEPKPTEQSELNLLDWELTLAPKAKQTLRFDFSVEAPQGMDVMGLPQG